MKKVIAPKAKFGYQIFEETGVYMNVDSAFRVNSGSKAGIDSMLDKIVQAGDKRLGLAFRERGKEGRSAIIDAHRRKIPTMSQFDQEVNNVIDDAVPDEGVNRKRILAIFTACRSNVISEAANNSMFDHVSPFINISSDITDLFTLYVRYKHRFCTSKILRAINETIKAAGMNIKPCSDAISMGIIANILLEPSLYHFCDFKHRKIAIEGTIKYRLDLSQFLLSGLGIDSGAKVRQGKAAKLWG
jgi:hypothetical protein